MDGKRIIMNFTVPPGVDDLEVIAEGVMETLPEELNEYCEELTFQIEELADDTTQTDYDLDDPFELLALFKSGKEMSPGVERKTADSDAVLILYRRPLLDLWCENGEDLTAIVREVIIEEIGKEFDFSGGEIDEMVQRHYQGML